MKHKDLSIEIQSETYKDNVISHQIGDKKAVWLPDCNKYILVFPPADEIIARIYKEESKKSITDYCINAFNFSLDQATFLHQTILQNIQEIQSENKVQKTTGLPAFNKSSTIFQHKNYYRSNGIVFIIEYETTDIKQLIHPKFAHLEIQSGKDINHHFQLYKTGLEIVLEIDGEYTGSWNMDHEHFMTGKVSMQILQKLYKKEEEDWMAVFHAAGISNGSEGILFPGVSGSGKSTLSALLMAGGYEVLADDFLPVESESTQMCFFPSAISVKKHAIDLLSDSFPELKNAKEYIYPAFNKTVKYLSNPNSLHQPKKVPCKALVFIKYDTEVELRFKALSQDIAFQKLVPDSWISPLEKNAEKFLKWFHQLPCYELVYSENIKMIKTVQSIFDEKI